MSLTRSLLCVFFAGVVSLISTASYAEVDPYETYVKTSKDFRAVRQDPKFLFKAFPSWTYMPWTYQWTIGYTEASGKWSVERGYNGAFVDHGNVEANGKPTGRLDWINEFHLRFYMDHTAAKHYLHLWDGNESQPHLTALHGNGVRSRPVNAAMAATLHEIISNSISNVKGSPCRAAYALDDEISWGHFVHPTMWCVTDDKGAYPAWLREIYGETDAPKRDRWITYNDIQPRLANWKVGEFDASPLMDQWTFNDSYWLNFIGDLVEYANSIDPATPCGFVGGQCPSPFGGYDYAKVMRKVQYIESYNIGSSQAIIRSFNPENAIPAVTSEFHNSSADDIWQTWYYLAHGNRGLIGWVEKWFDGDKPRPWHDEVAPANLEAANKIGPLMSRARWKHDGIAIYYSHPSIQLGWILDAQAHGKTWINRNGDDRLGASHQVRRAWENMLRDSGYQYNFISYADVIQNGIGDEYKVLILPACLCLSDVEARRIKEFCQRGGVVVADYLPGVWDQHGKGRPDGGALDDLFGVKHPPTLGASDLFNGGRLWTEVDQDANFGWKTYDEFLTHQNTCIKDPCGFNKAVRGMPTVNFHVYGNGSATLLNLSPQWYNAYRIAGVEPARRRSIFLEPIVRAIHLPPTWIAPSDFTFGAELTTWRKGDRTIIFVVANPETAVTDSGGGNSVGLETDTVPITIQFAQEIKGARDERTGKDLGSGKAFTFQWKRNEAIVLSFER